MKRLIRILALTLSFVLVAAFFGACAGNQDPGKEPGGETPGGGDETPGGGDENPGGGDEELDMSKYPLYNEKYETMTYDAEEYASKLSQPYWLGNVIYNELALPIEYENGEAYANLLYKPLKVVQVMDQKLGKVYEEGVDYTVDEENGRLVIPDGSSIPLINEKAITGTTVEELTEAAPEGYNYAGSLQDGVIVPPDLSSYVIWDFGMGPYVYTESSFFYGKYLSVTYAYDVRDLPSDIFADYDLTMLNGVRSKLEKGEDISLVVIGDSISAGSSSTGDNLYVDPYTPCYANQLKAELERVYGVNVTLTNSAVGGTKSEYPLTGEGSMKLQNALNAKPDLCIIAYGMNDATDSEVTPVYYKNNIEEIMLRIKVASPDCNFILVNSFPCNELDTRASGKFDEYLKQLERIQSSHNDGTVTVVDMYKVGNYFLESKFYSEISSSNNNHPNDFMHRVYAMNLMSVICDYKK